MLIGLVSEPALQLKLLLASRTQSHAIFNLMVFTQPSSIVISGLVSLCSDSKHFDASLQFSYATSKANFDVLLAAECFLRGLEDLEFGRKGKGTVAVPIRQLSLILYMQKFGIKNVKEHRPLLSIYFFWAISIPSVDAPSTNGNKESTY